MRGFQKNHKNIATANTYSKLDIQSVHIKIFT